MIERDKKDGQIQPDSEFGKEITQYAAISETIVEIGTWLGAGSTLCVELGLTRESQKFWTIEIDCYKVIHARKHSENPRTRFLWGSLVKQKDSPLIKISELPPVIDLLILDGGENTSDYIFDMLHPNSKWIAFDDVCKQKNKRQLEIIESRPDKFEVLYKKLDNRNGELIALNRDI